MNTVITLCVVSILIGYVVAVIVKKNMVYRGVSTTKFAGVTHGVFTALVFIIVNLILPAIDAGGISLKFLWISTALIMVSSVASVLVTTSVKSIR